MAAFDYERIAKKAKDNFFSDDEISKENKNAVKGFLLDYHESPARKHIVLNHLRVFLKKAKNIKEDMHNETAMNAIYRAIYKEKPGYFETIRNVSKMFCRRVNDEILPDAVRKALKKIP